MISRILVPTDFSETANNALTFALKIAHKTGAEVQLLHVQSVPITDAYLTPGTYEIYLEEARISAEKSFGKLKNDFYHEGHIPFKATCLQGSVCNEILQYAEKKQTDLIVMGTRGTSVLIGSNTASVIARSITPLLVIPPSASYHDFSKIVYASDYSEPEFPSVSRLVYFAELYNASVTVLHINSEYDQLFKTENNFFIKNKDHISYKKWRMVNTNAENIMDGINQFIIEAHADLLVIAKHNRSFFDRILHRSLSKHMVYHTGTPLLVLNKEIR